MINVNFALFVVTLAAVTEGLAVIAVAQETSQPSESKIQPAADESGMSMEDQRAQMSDMASSMKSMADMCRMMMQREMELRPYLMAAGAAVGGIGLAALVLLIVLEIQGIRFLSVRIQSERQKLMKA